MTLVMECQFSVPKGREFSENDFIFLEYWINFLMISIALFCKNKPDFCHHVSPPIKKQKQNTLNLVAFRQKLILHSQSHANSLYSNFSIF